MARTSHYAQGQFNVICDRCGLKIKSDQARKTWDGFYVCERHWEPRNPLDFTYGVKDDQSVPFSRPSIEAVQTIKTSAYLILASDDTVLADVSAGGFAVTLPASPTPMETHFIKKVDSSSNVLTINGNGHSVQMSSLSSPASGVLLAFNAQWIILDAFPSGG